MFDWSNFLAVFWVLFTTVIGARYIVPSLSSTTGKVLYIHLLVWGFPFIAGQVMQNARLGSLWLQYQLCDLGYAVWAPTLGISAIGLLQRLRGKNFTEQDIRRWSIRSFWGFTVLGHGMELWDTLWAWYYDGSLATAIDWGDYIVLTGGALLALNCYMRFGWPRFVTQVQLTTSKN